MKASTQYEETFARYRGELVPRADPQLVQILAGMPAAKDIAILDAGCGSGRYANTLVAQGYGHIACVDIIEPNRAAMPPNFSRASLDDLPFGDDTFDFIYANSVIYHLPDQRKALAELKRVAKPGAVIVISGHAVTSPATAWRRLKRSMGARSAAHLAGVRFHTPRYYADIFRDLGFSEIRYDGFTRLPGRIGRLVFRLLLRRAAPEISYRQAKSRWHGVLRAYLAYHFVIVARG